MTEENMNKTSFAVLSAVSVNGMTEKKGGLTYLSWAYAWAEVKKRYPFATYTVYENESGWNYFTDGRTAWVKTGVTINGLEHIEYLPVMDHRNNSIPLEKVTSQDVNKAIQRSITKRIARHGLGLYIYQGEDLPEGEAEEKQDLKPQPMPEDYIEPQWLNRTCEICGKRITPKVAKRSFEVFNGHMFCSKECAEKGMSATDGQTAIERTKNEIEKNLKGKAKK